MSKEAKNEVRHIPIGDLVQFEFHIFKPYDNKRLERLRQSIEKNGIIHPIVVRITKGKDGKEKIEIVSGHSRVAAANLAGLTEMPCVIRNLTDDEAKLVANEANIESRQWGNWFESEKILSINQYQDALKSQGSKKNSKSPVGDNRQKSENSYARQRTAAVYGLSPSTVRVYTELGRLIEPLQGKLDSKDLGTTPAAEISFINSEGQKLVNSIFEEDMKVYKITVKKSEKLRAFFEDQVKESLTKETEESVKNGIRQILNQPPNDSDGPTDDKFIIPIPMDAYKDLFPDAPPLEEIVAYTIKAIETLRDKGE